MTSFASFVAEHRRMMARYGFAAEVLTDAEVEHAARCGLTIDETYGLACDVNAGVSWLTALRMALRRAGKEEENASYPQPQVIDVTPTWSALIPVFRAVIEDGVVPSSVNAMWTEIERMAKIADLYVTAHKEGKV